VAAVHAGWRGAAVATAVKAIQFLVSEFGSQPEEVEVAIGPGICGRCYEVGPEVARRFAAWLPELAEASKPTRLDLAEVTCRQLLGAGISPEGLHLGAPCTACSPEEFYSYRRQGLKAGRMLSGIGIRPR